MRNNALSTIPIVGLVFCLSPRTAVQAELPLSSLYETDSVTFVSRRDLADRIQSLPHGDKGSSIATRHLAAQLWAVEGETDKALSLLHGMDEKNMCSFSLWTKRQLKARKQGRNIAVTSDFDKGVPRVAFPYVFALEPLAMRRRIPSRLLFEKATDINPESTVAYLWLLRIDRSFNSRIRLLDQLSYCARIMILEETGSPLYREALDHLHWVTHEDASHRLSPDDVGDRFRPQEMIRTLEALVADKPELAGTVRLLQALIWSAEGDIQRAREMLGAIEEKQLDAFAMGLMLRLGVENTRGGKTVGLREIANLEPKLAFPYVITANRPEKEMFGGQRQLLASAIKINPEFSQAYMELLRLDRSLKRKSNLAQQLEYCSRLLILEKNDSPLYRETWEHLEWLMTPDPK